MLGLVTCSRPINSLEAFYGFVLGFLSYMVYNSQLSVTVSLCPFAKLVSIYFCNFEFSANWANFNFNKTTSLVLYSFEVYFASILDLSTSIISQLLFRYNKVGMPKCFILSV